MSGNRVCCTGFELVSGSPTVTETSDLDIVVRAPEPFDRAFARSICIQPEGAPARVDVLIETPCCRFSLDEYAHSQLKKVLVRTGTRRTLADDPWDGGRQSWRKLFCFQVDIGWYFQTKQWPLQ